MSIVSVTSQLSGGNTSCGSFCWRIQLVKYVRVMTARAQHLLTLCAYIWRQRFTGTHFGKTGLRVALLCYVLVGRILSRASMAALSTVVRTTIAFLWQQNILGYLPSRNHSTNQYKILLYWFCRWGHLMCQKWLESDGWRRPLRWVNYNLKNFPYYTLPYFTLPYLFYL
jgi:hypothetical protein